MVRVAPVAIGSAWPVTCGAVLYRAWGHLCLTVAVKASFTIAQDGRPGPTTPAPWTPIDVRTSEHPLSSLRVASDLVPARPQADVLLAGHAHASWVRLRISRDGATLLDKAAHVRQSARAAGLAGAARGPHDTCAPVPLIYELAAGGPGSPHNPVGRPDPLIVHPWHPSIPIGFGPIAADWPARAHLCEGWAQQAAEAPVLDLPARLSWAFFQAAPPDQRTSFLTGTEWVYLEGVFPDMPWVQFHLPRIHAEARVAVPGAEPRTARLVADTLLIDADERVCSLVFRGQLGTIRAEALPAMQVWAGVAPHGEHVPFPRAAPPPAAPPKSRASLSPPGPRAKPAAAVRSTIALSPEAIAQLREIRVLPFEEVSPRPVTPAREPEEEGAAAVTRTRPIGAGFRPSPAAVLPFRPSPPVEATPHNAYPEPPLGPETQRASLHDAAPPADTLDLSDHADGSPPSAAIPQQAEPLPSSPPAALLPSLPISPSLSVSPPSPSPPAAPPPDAAQGLGAFFLASMGVLDTPPPASTEPPYARD